MLTLQVRTQAYTLILIMLCIEECLTLFYNSNIVLLYVFFIIMHNIWSSINMSMETVFQQYIGLIAHVQFLNYQYINSIKHCLYVRYVLANYKIISHKLLQQLHSIIIEKYWLYMQNVRYDIVNLIHKLK